MASVEIWNRDIPIFIECNDDGMLVEIEKILPQVFGNIVIRTAVTINDDLRELAAYIPDILIMDINGSNGLKFDLLDKILDQYPSIKIIIITQSSTIPIAVKCMKKGVTDFILYTEDFLDIFKESLSVIAKQLLFESNLNHFFESIFKPENFLSIFYKASENGIDCIFKDFIFFPESLEIDQDDFIKQIGLSILVAIGQGHTYSEGVYSLPAGISKQYSLVVITQRLPDKTSKDPRLNLGYLVYTLFVPNLFLPFIPPNSDLIEIFPIIKSEINDLSDIGFHEASNIKRKIVSWLKEKKYGQRQGSIDH